jgi:hypothetical protein
MKIGNIKKNNVSGGVKCGWCMGLTTLPPSMSRLSKQCEIPNISQPYRPPRPATGIAFFMIAFDYGILETGEVVRRSLLLSTKAGVT